MCAFPIRRASPLNLYQISHISSPFHSFDSFHPTVFNFRCACHVSNDSRPSLFCFFRPCLWPFSFYRSLLMLLCSKSIGKWRLKIFGELKHLQFCISIIIKRELHVLDSVVFLLLFFVITSLAYSLSLYLSFPLFPYSSSSVYRIFRNDIVVMWATFKNCTISMVSKTDVNEVGVSTILW